MAGEPTKFTSSAKLRAWLERHHAVKTELIIRCFKVDASERGVTYKQMLDELLCFGWIDGVRRSVDDVSFSIRISPRKPKSRWSLVNIRRAKELEAAGRMHAAGLAVFNARDVDDARRYSFESRELELSQRLAKTFRAAKRAWKFFESQPPGYRRTVKFWVMSAKQEATRARRLRVLIDCCERGTTIPMLTRKSKRSR